MKVLPIGGRVYHSAAPAQGSVGAFCDGDGPSGPSRPALVAATHDAQ